MTYPKNHTLIIKNTKISSAILALAFLTPTILSNCQDGPKQNQANPKKAEQVVIKKIPAKPLSEKEADKLQTKPLVAKGRTVSQTQIAKRDKFLMTDAYPEPQTLFVERRRQAAEKRLAGAQTVLKELTQQSHKAPLKKMKVKSSSDVAGNRQAHGSYFAPPVHAEPQLNNENYHHVEDNNIKLVGEDPVSTFSVDVDTASYSNVRRMIENGHMPNKNAVRAEELINYFSYHYPAPKSNKQPFSIQTELAASPWDEDKVLLHVGLQAYDVDKENLPPSNLVFLVDVSGSMNSTDKLDLLKTSLKMLSRQLRSEDTISLVVYAGASGVVLDGAEGNDQTEIARALNQLNAGGSTNGGAGIELAYQIAQKHFKPKGINRVLLATDGDFNVGISDFGQLTSLIEDKRKSDISLSTLGFGTGNYNDHLMEQLADKGNGNYAYINNINEARKVLVDEMSSTLNTVAKDVKIQIEFNPAQVAEYRLIGYENRVLKREDFNNDKIDAGEIGAGHSVTAIYELALTGEKSSIDPLRYFKNRDKEDKTMNRSSTKLNQELAFIKLRYKSPTGEVSKKISQSIAANEIERNIAKASQSFKFSAAVAAYSQKLRNSQYLDDYSYQSIIDLANTSKGEDTFGYRSEFINMVRTTKALAG